MASGQRYARPPPHLPIPSAAALLPGFSGDDEGFWTFVFENDTSLWATDVAGDADTGVVQQYILALGSWVPQGYATLDANAPVYSLMGRYESNVATGHARRFVLYGTTDTTLYRYDPAAALPTPQVTVVATAAAGQHFRGVAAVPACPHVPVRR